MISVSQLISLTPKTSYKIDVQPVNCRKILPRFQSNARVTKSIEMCRNQMKRWRFDMQNGVFTLYLPSCMETEATVESSSTRTSARNSSRTSSWNALFCSQWSIRFRARISWGNGHTPRHLMKGRTERPVSANRSKPPPAPVIYLYR